MLELPIIIGVAVVIDHNRKRVDVQNGSVSPDCVTAYSLAQIFEGVVCNPCKSMRDPGNEVETSVNTVDSVDQLQFSMVV